MISHEKALFLRELLRTHAPDERGRYNHDRPMTDELAISLGIHPKRGNAWAEAFETKGWWESGVSTRTGWLTPKGAEGVTRALAEYDRCWS